MRTYSEPLLTRNGLSLVEVHDKDAAGRTIIIGYAILDADGKEIDFFGDYDDALAEFLRLADDEEPPPPGNNGP